MDTLTRVRVLVITNFEPDDSAPQRGRWVRDQINEVRRRGIDVDVFSFPPGRNEYIPATRRLRTLLRRERFDLVHAHYGLPGWCAKLAGAAPLIVTFHGTDVRHGIVGPLSRRLAWRVDLVAAVSRALFAPEDGRAGLPPVPGSAVLPCGPDLGRFGPIPRSQARRSLGLDPDGRYLFFPANPARPEKRHDRAAELAARCGAELLSGGSIEPERMPLWLNAANAVLVTSDYEGFGLAAVEALACEVPVLSTPVGIAPYALGGIDGCLCAPFDPADWAAVLDRHLEAPDPRVAGAARASSLSAERMADRAIEAYRDVTHTSVLD
ncbi:MAG TPA: glycosyltransferase family 4 protein [Solirubrobacterales bacterium]|nr:glycosyltransferase family 4 protein [Solirubrobacterales bacterium]